MLDAAGLVNLPLEEGDAAGAAVLRARSDCSCSARRALNARPSAEATGTPHFATRLERRLCGSLSQHRPAARACEA